MKRTVYDAATKALLAAAIARAKAAEARVAELEAALAVQQWQPGGAAPPAPDWYWVFDFDEDDVPSRRFYRGNGSWGMQGECIAPDWWLSIPPLPQEKTQ